MHEKTSPLAAGRILKWIRQRLKERSQNHKNKLHINLRQKTDCFYCYHLSGFVGWTASSVWSDWLQSGVCLLVSNLTLHTWVSLFAEHLCALNFQNGVLKKTPVGDSHSVLRPAGTRTCLKLFITYSTNTLKQHITIPYLKKKKKSSVDGFVF